MCIGSETLLFKQIMHRRQKILLVYYHHRMNQKIKSFKLLKHDVGLLIRADQHCDCSRQENRVRLQMPLCDGRSCLYQQCCDTLLSMERKVRGPVYSLDYCFRRQKNTGTSVTQIVFRVRSDCLPRQYTNANSRSLSTFSQQGTSFTDQIFAPLPYARKEEINTLFQLTKFGQTRVQKTFENAKSSKEKYRRRSENEFPVSIRLPECFIQ